jgi:hypothetical protein
LKDNEQKQKKIITDKLRTILPDNLQLEDDILWKLYETSISIRQSNCNQDGIGFERVICKCLRKENIKYKTQVCIDQNGYITSRKTNNNIIDIVVGNNITIGKHISDNVVISCKKSCRERWKQDGWSIIHKPQKYLLVTVSNDYPSSDKFSESVSRKIITCKPKKKDNRTFKLSFTDLINEIEIYQ